MPFKFNEAQKLIKDRVFDIISKNDETGTTLQKLLEEFVPGYSSNTPLPNRDEKTREELIDNILHILEFFECKRLIYKTTQHINPRGINTWYHLGDKDWVIIFPTPLVNTNQQ